MGAACILKEDSTMTSETKTDAATSNAPSHIVYFVPERENAPWTRIGAQWPTKNGKGFRQALNFAPLGPGNIVVLPNEAKPVASGEHA